MVERAAHDATPGFKLVRWFSKQPELPATSVDLDTALACLSRLGSDSGIHTDPDVARRRVDLAGPTLTLPSLARLAGEFGFAGSVEGLSWRQLFDRPLRGPVLLALRNGNAVALVGLQKGQGEAPDKVAVVDPLFRSGEVFLLEQDRLEASWDGMAVTLGRAAVEEAGGFGFGWFGRKLRAERGVMRDIALAALAMHAIALAIPIFFQILIDKVVPNRGLSTLAVITAGIAVLILFDGGFNYLRNYLLSHLARKLDYLISNETVGHLLKLPLGYFNSNPSGVVVHKLQEAAQVREFLTGRLFNTVLDLLAVVLYLPVLFLYSWQLTLVVLVLSFMTFVILAVAARSFRGKLELVNQIEGRRKAILVEMIQGIATIKTLALEPRLLRQWRGASFDSASGVMALGELSARARASLEALQKVMSVGVGAIGALLVLQDQITVGALIAFNMLGLRIAGPLIQASGLLQDYQKARLSLRHLGQLMDTPAEPQHGQLLAKVEGAISFEDVSFHYPGAPQAALKGVSFEIRPGELVGVVGRSGSGKTTITRLIQGLYTPQGGLVKIDGQNVRDMDLSHLRSQVGVVLQENFLFRGTIRDNIAMSRPEASMPDILRVSQMSGAHEFVQRLPQGYATMLEEGASNLSGGQRQRLAIARALLRDPKILIFDEATSALDPESEAVIQANLAAMARGPHRGDRDPPAVVRPRGRQHCRPGPGRAGRCRPARRPGAELPDLQPALEPAGPQLPMSISTPTIGGSPAPRNAGSSEDYDLGSMSEAPAPRAILYLMMGLLASAVVWLSVSMVDVTVLADGKIITTQTQTVLQPIETSVIREIAVKPGDAVKQGQVLARLDPTVTAADAARTASKLRQLTANVDRLTAELGGHPYAARAGDEEALLQADIDRRRRLEYAARIDAYQRKVEQSRAGLAGARAATGGLTQQIKLGRDLTQRYQTLFDQQLTGKPKLIEAQQQLTDAELKLTANAGEQQRLLKEIASGEAERDAYRQEWARNASEELAKSRADPRTGAGRAG